MAVVTVSRGLGSNAEAIVNRAAELLGYEVVDKHLIAEVAREASVSETDVQYLDENEEPGLRGILLRWLEADSVATASAFDHALGYAVAPLPRAANEPDVGEEWHFLDRYEYHEIMQRTIRRLYQRDNVIVVGRGGMMVLADAANVLRVRIIATRESRGERLAAREGIAFKEALRRIDVSDRRRSAFIRRWYHADWCDSGLYHLIINTETLLPETAAATIAAAARATGSARPETPMADPAGTGNGDGSRQVNGQAR